MVTKVVDELLITGDVGHVQQVISNLGQRFSLIVSFVMWSTSKVANLPKQNVIIWAKYEKWLRKMTYTINYSEQSYFCNTFAAIA